MRATTATKEPGIDDAGEGSLMGERRIGGAPGRVVGCVRTLFDALRTIFQAHRRLTRALSTRNGTGNVFLGRWLSLSRPALPASMAPSIFLLEASLFRG